MCVCMIIFMKGRVMINLLKNFILIFVIFLIIEMFSNIILSNRKNKFFNIQKINNRINNTSFIKKIKYYIEYLKNININLFCYINPITIILISIFISIITFFISYKFISVFSSAIIISVYSFFIPYLILKYIYNDYRKKIMDIFPTYIVSLKNYTIISNDIIIAMRKVKVEPPLMIFIDKFNILTEKGVTVYEAFQKLKNDIKINKISEFITALQNCYINGGNFSELLDKYSKILTNINNHREKENQENFSSILVLIILVIINIFLIINFVYSNQIYREIVVNSFIGKTILNINILSYLLVFYFIKKLDNLEG